MRFQVCYEIVQSTILLKEEVAAGQKCRQGKTDGVGLAHDHLLDVANEFAKRFGKPLCLIWCH